MDVVNMGYCPKHDIVYTLPRWNTKDEPIYQCSQCRREFFNAFYAEFDSQFEDGNQEKYEYYKNS